MLVKGNYINILPEHCRIITIEESAHELIIYFMQPYRKKKKTILTRLNIQGNTGWV